MLCVLRWVSTPWPLRPPVYIPQDFLIFVFSSQYFQTDKKNMSCYMSENTDKTKHVVCAQVGLYAVAPAPEFELPVSIADIEQGLVAI